MLIWRCFFLSSVHSNNAYAGGELVLGLGGCFFRRVSSAFILGCIAER
jgi:hypothetical protein